MEFQSNLHHASSRIHLAMVVILFFFTLRHISYTSLIWLKDVTKLHSLQTAYLLTNPLCDYDDLVMRGSISTLWIASNFLAKPTAKALIPKSRSVRV